MNLLSNKKIIAVNHGSVTTCMDFLKEYIVDKAKLVMYIDYCINHGSGEKARKPKSEILIYLDNELKSKDTIPLMDPTLFSSLKQIYYMLYYIVKRREHFDICITDSCIFTIIAILFKKFNKIDKCIYYTIDYYTYENKWLNKIYSLLDKIACYYSDSIWVLSPKIIENREKIGIKQSAKSIVVPVGTNYHINTNQMKNKNRNYIVYMGELSEHRGISIIPDIIQNVLKKTNINFIIIGTGPSENLLKKRITELNLSEYVEFKGYIKDHGDLEKIVASCSIGIAPYKPSKNNPINITNPGKPILYMAAGLPVIITNKFPFSQEIENANAGLSVDYDAEKFANAIIKLLNDNDLYNELSNNAIRFASQYDWKFIFTKAFDVE